MREQLSAFSSSKTLPGAAATPGSLAGVGSPGPGLLGAGLGAGAGVGRPGSGRNPSPARSISPGPGGVSTSGAAGGGNVDLARSLLQQHSAWLKSFAQQLSSV